MDELVGLATRAQTCIGKELVETDRLCRIDRGQLILYALGAGSKALVVVSTIVALGTIVIVVTAIVIATTIVVVTVAVIVIVVLLY